MSLTPGVLIERARDRSPLFDRRRHPDPTLLRALSGEERRLVGKALQLNPSTIAATLTVELADYDFATGAPLPALHSIHSAVAVPAGADCPPFPVAKLNFADRTRVRPRLGYSVQGSALYLAGDSDDWEGIERLDLSYAPIPVDLAALTDPMVLPDTAESYLVSFLAHFMARRLPAAEMPPAELAQFVAERQAAEIDFLEAIRSTYVARTFRVQEVW